MEDELEHLLRFGLVVHEGLPLACRARVARDRVVGLEPELALERRLDLALVSARAGEDGPAKLSLEEELRVKEAGGGVKRRARYGRVDVVRRSDSVRGEEPNGEDLVKLALRGVGKAAEDLVGRVERLGDEAVWGGLSGVLATDEGGELRGTRAVGQGNSTGELDTATTRSASGSYEYYEASTYKSATDKLWRATNGFCNSTISSRPMLGWKFVSISGKIAMEPSAPPPL